MRAPYSAAGGNQGERSLLEIAMGAGELSSSVRSQVGDILSEHRHHPVKAIHVGLDELARQGVINAHEATDLREACRHVFQVLRLGRDGDDAACRVRQIYHGLLLSDDCSPVAVAVAGVANQAFHPSGVDRPAAWLDSSESEGQAATPDAFVPDAAAVAALAGAIVGSLVGHELAGLRGAAVAAAVGGAVGGSVAPCNGAGEAEARTLRD